MPQDILSIVSSTGSVGVVLLLLLWFRNYLTECTKNQQEWLDKSNARADAIIAQSNERVDRLISDHRSEMQNVIAQFRADLTTISADTTQAIEALTGEVKTLAGKIKE